MSVVIIFSAAAVITIGVYVILDCLMRMDKEHGMNPGNREGALLILGSLIMSCMWFGVTMGETVSVKAAWLILCIYFLSSSLMDIMTCQVYDVIQFLGIGAAVCLLTKEQPSTSVGVSVLIFAILQKFIFIRLYGSADGMTFMIAALAEGALGYDINIYFLHMIIAYLLLAAVQICRGNIAGKGRLKQPVPFLPYITAGFCIVTAFGGRV